MFCDFTEATVSVFDLSTESPYRITTNTGCGDLVRSIERAGLIHPPILSARKEVICGFRRIAAVKALGWKTLPVLLLPLDAVPLDCALLAISENASERPLNLIETSRAISLLTAFLEDKKSLPFLARDLGVPGGESFYEKITFLCRLPESVQAGVLSGDIGLPSATLLEKMGMEGMLAVSDLLQKLKLNLNKQRELIGLLKEISSIEDKVIPAIIQSREIAEILDDPETDTPRKAAIVRRLLKKWRFPNITKAEEDFDRLKTDLNLGDKASLTPPPGFEGNRYTLTLSFATLKDLDQHSKMVSGLVRNDAMKSLLESR